MLLLSGEGETPGQTVPLSMDLPTVPSTSSSLLQQHNKAPKPPEMNLHTQQHLSLSDQTWSNMSVTHCTLQLKKSKAPSIVPWCRRLGAPAGLVTCPHPGSLPLHAHTVFTALLCQPHCQLWECQHASSPQPVESHEKPSACVLNQCWLMKYIWHPKASCAPFHS